ncbi:DoxX family membrane protein [Alteromonas sp. H39]|uniref:HvfX family Cu-binding RiPP maturation protein n=1 Tax=Alteromonas sp. H39 TaxID=3389876 RepID=UPI0039DFDF99
MLTSVYYGTISGLRHADGIPLLLLRLYLAPVMIQAGWSKATAFGNIVDWFGNPEWGLGLPFPELLALLATAAELGGGVLLLIGLGTRLVTVPLMITMLVAMVTVHAQHGWLAIADASSWFADGTVYFDGSVLAAPEKLAAANALLEKHGDIQWLTSSGKFVILNNGVEFAATYFIMLAVLLFYGGGRFVSADDVLARFLAKKTE